jgi:Rho GTPase-activating protein RGD1
VRFFIANLNEKLLLGQGLCVSPLKSQLNGTGPETKSLREVARQIDNEKDFKDYVLSFSNRTGVRSSEIKYERHPVGRFPPSKQALTDHSSGLKHSAATTLLPNH